MGPKRNSRNEKTKPRLGKQPDRSWAVPPAIFLWTLAFHLTFLIGNVDRLSPDSFFFVGESREILQQAGTLAASSDLQAAWGLQTPLTVWLLMPLCRIFANPDLLHLACKASMAFLNGLFFALLYIPLREHISRQAAAICFLLPLSFGELLLSSAINSEVIYRLLLLIIVTLGWRWPVLAGVLHALAVSAHMEHLAFAILIGIALAVLLPDRRKNIVISGFTLGILLAIWGFMGTGSTSQPPPITVAKNLSTELETLEAIETEFASLPRRMFSGLGSASYGWTWRDFPKQATWVRNPADLAYSKTRWYEITTLVCVMIGIWRLRRDGALLMLAALFVSYRLVMIGFGTPPLRSMMICSPFILVFMITGATAAVGRFANRGAAACILILALMHLPNAWRPRRYLELESTFPAGQASQDRPVTLVYQGRYRSEQDF